MSEKNIWNIKIVNKNCWHWGSCSWSNCQQQNCHRQHFFCTGDKYIGKSIRKRLVTGTDHLYIMGEYVCMYVWSGFFWIILLIRCCEQSEQSCEWSEQALRRSWLAEAGHTSASFNNLLSIIKVWIWILR